MASATQDEIRTRAYSLWKAASEPKKDKDYYWYKAEDELNCPKPDVPTPPDTPTPPDNPTPPDVPTVPPDVPTPPDASTPVDPVPSVPVESVPDNSIDNLLGR